MTDEQLKALLVGQLLPHTIPKRSREVSIYDTIHPYYDQHELDRCIERAVKLAERIMEKSK